MFPEKETRKINNLDAKDTIEDGFKLYTVKKEVFYRTPKKGSGDVEKHPNNSKVSKKE
jgi:hypothetical protein